MSVKDEQPSLWGPQGGAVHFEAHHGMHAMTVMVVDGAVELTIGKRALRLTRARAAALSAALSMAAFELGRAA